MLMLNKSKWVRVFLCQYMIHYYIVIVILLVETFNYHKTPHNSMKKMLECQICILFLDRFDLKWGIKILLDPPKIKVLFELLFERVIYYDFLKALAGRKMASDFQNWLCLSSLCCLCSINMSPHSI